MQQRAEDSGSQRGWSPASAKQPGDQQYSNLARGQISRIDFAKPIIFERAGRIDKRNERQKKGDRSAPESRRARSHPFPHPAQAAFQFIRHSKPPETPYTKSHSPCVLPVASFSGNTARVAAKPHQRQDARPARTAAMLSPAAPTRTAAAACNHKNSLVSPQIRPTILASAVSHPRFSTCEHPVSGGVLAAERFQRLLPRPPAC